jgi:hypothetical protein
MGMIVAWEKGEVHRCQMFLIIRVNIHNSYTGTTGQNRKILDFNNSKKLI